MPSDDSLLSRVFDGWEGHNQALAQALAPRSPEQLAFRAAPHLRSVGEIASHISQGRISWFARMDAPGSADLARELEALPSENAFAEQPAEVVKWLEASWRMIEQTLNTWTVADLWQTYRQAYQGRVYAVSRQWTIWRVLSHDIHHGGEIAFALGLQKIDIPDLGEAGGHLTEPPLAE